MQKKKASFLSALALTAGLFLSSCGAPSEATEFATVNYYDNAPMPSLVGVDYVVKGRATSYRGYTKSEGESVTYDFLDRSGVIPAVGTYRTFKEWDYGIYLPSEEVVLDSSSEEESIILPPPRRHSRILMTSTSGSGLRLIRSFISIRR